jgi:hypothetical protein
MIYLLYAGCYHTKKSRRHTFGEKWGLLEVEVVLLEHFAKHHLEKLVTYLSLLDFT